MTVHIRRYKWLPIPIDQVNQFIDPAFPASISNAWSVPTFDLSVDDSTYGDVDSAMAELGWTFVAVDPPAAGDTVGVPYGYFGDGFDGVFTFDGVATPSFATRVGSIYTLTRDVVLDTATVNAGVQVQEGGQRFFVKNQLTNNGIISADGGAAAGAAAGAGAPTSSVFGGGNGATGAGGVGVAGSAPPQDMPQAPAGTGNGGAGGTGNGGLVAGGAGGVTTIAPAGDGTGRHLPDAIVARLLVTSGTYLSGGAGGGSGGGAGGNSGGGGGGAGVAVVAARVIRGVGIIRAAGGAGGNAVGTNAGGGGGGGGGVAIVVSADLGAGQTISAPGGAGGAKNGTGVAGSAGNAGATIVLAP